MLHDPGASMKLTDTSAAAQQDLATPLAPTIGDPSSPASIAPGAEQIRILVERIAQSLVDLPDQVCVEAIRGEQAVVLEVSVALADVGKIIGKQGRNARAIRTILNAVGMKLKKHFTLEILD
jgi:uncharacterized protein